MQWPNLPDELFVSLGARHRVTGALAYLEGLVPELAMRCSPHVRAVVSECDQRHCTSSSCRLHRGCIVAVASQLDRPFTEQGGVEDVYEQDEASFAKYSRDKGVQLEWLSMPQINSQLQSASLLHAASTADRHSTLLMAVHIPSNLLSGVVVQGKCPKAGLVGWTRVDTLQLSAPLARYCYGRLMQYKGAAEAAAAAAVDAGAPSKVSQGGGEAAGVEAAADAAALAAAASAAAAAAVEAEVRWDPTRPSLRLISIGSFQAHGTGLVLRLKQRHDGAARKQGKLQEAAGQAKDVAHEGRPMGDAEQQEQKRVDEQLYWLRVTINDFWRLANASLKYLSHRVRKVHCKIAGKGEPPCGRCSGCQAAAARMMGAAAGAAAAGPASLSCLLLQPLTLHSASQPHFTYVHLGKKRESSEHKLRCDRTSVHELADLGLCDVQLLHDLAVHDPQTHFVVVLHLPSHLVGHLLEEEKQQQLGSWAEADTQQQQQQLEGDRQAQGGTEPAEAGQQVRHQEKQQGGQHGIFFWYTFRHPDPERQHEDEEVGDEAVAVTADDIATALAGSDLQRTDSHKSNSSQPHGNSGNDNCNSQTDCSSNTSQPRRCCLPACRLSEDTVHSHSSSTPRGTAPSPGCQSSSRSGIHLLVCHGCRSACYCTPQHQRLHWKQHREACLAAAAAGGRGVWSLV